MRAWRIEGGFGLDHLRLVEVPDPQAGAGEALVRLGAVTLNYRDLLMVEGRYDPRQALPLVPCSDGCGTVVAVGPGVTRVGVGDRVIPAFAPTWIAGRPTRERLRTTLGGPLPGTLAELIVAPAEGLVAAPPRLDDIEAASLPCAALTAWTALVVDGPLEPGQTVLVIGSGGVSTIAIQIAVNAGARVIATSRSPEKHQRLRELGAEAIIDTREQPAWGREVRRWAAGVGVDHVVEVGGAGTLEQSLAATRFGGHVALIGVLAGSAAPLRLTDILMRRLRVEGVLVGDRDGLETLVRAYQHTLAPPVIDTAFPFDQAPAAFARLASGEHFGKIALTLA